MSMTPEDEAMYRAKALEMAQTHAHQTFGSHNPLEILAIAGIYYDYITGTSGHKSPDLPTPD